MRALRGRGVLTAIVSTAVVAAGVLSVCIVFGPKWIVGATSGLSAVDRLKAENDVRSTLLQGLGGIVALSGIALGALMTLRQVGANREGQLINLFTKAIDQLASAEITVRHGGVYALERLSELDPRYGAHSHALLTAFIRNRAPWPARDPDATPRQPSRVSHDDLADDVAAALAVLDRGVMIADGDASEIERVDLRGANLDGLHIPRLCLANSNLDGASLVNAKLGDATLAGVSLREADLSGADLHNANLTGADLHGAVLRGADLSEATLTGAELSRAVADQTTRWPAGVSPVKPT